MTPEQQRLVNLVQELTQQETSSTKKAAVFGVNRHTINSWLKGGKVSSDNKTKIAELKGWTVPQLENYLRTGSIEIGDRFSLSHIEQVIFSGSYDCKGNEIELLGKIARAAVDRQLLKLGDRELIDTTSLSVVIKERVKDWKAFYALYPSNDEEELNVVRGIVAGIPTAQTQIEDVRNAIFYTIEMLEASSKQASIVQDSQIKFSA